MSDFNDIKKDSNPSKLMTDDLKSIDLIECPKLIANKENAKRVHTTLENMQEYNSWYLFKDVPHYFKRGISNLVILNELIGQELSIYMNLPTIEYNIATIEGNIAGLISKLFLDGTYEHVPGACVISDIYKLVRKMLTDSSFKCDELTREKMTSILVRNFYASLGDRLSNCYIGIKDGKLIVSPLFDYEASFLNPEMYFYADPLFGYCFDYESIPFIKENNEYFCEYLNRVYDYSVLISLENIKKKHGINVPDSYTKYYVDYENKRKNYMKSLGL